MTLGGIAGLVFAFGILIFFIRPAKVYFEGDFVYFSVWGVPLKPRLISDIAQIRLKMGMFPILIKFKDDSSYKWSSFGTKQRFTLLKNLEAHKQQKITVVTD